MGDANREDLADNEVEAKKEVTVLVTGYGVSLDLIRLPSLLSFGLCVPL